MHHVLRSSKRGGEGEEIVKIKKREEGEELAILSYIQIHLHIRFDGVGTRAVAIPH